MIASLAPIENRSAASFGSSSGAGRNKVGPNTVAKLCKFILFSLSYWETLKQDV